MGRIEEFDMAVTISISLFFGIVAAIALFSCTCSIRQGLAHWRKLRAELAAIDRASKADPRQLRRPREAFTLLAA